MTYFVTFANGMLFFSESQISSHIKKSQMTFGISRILTPSYFYGISGCSNRKENSLIPCVREFKDSPDVNVWNFNKDIGP